MPENEAKTIRRRTQVSTTAGGVKTHEATVEIINGTREEQMAEQKWLADEMEREFPTPPQKEVKK